MQRALLVVCLSCLLTSLAGAQTKMSSTIKCGKYSVEQMVPAGDHPNHSFGVEQGSCTSSKPWTIAGLAGKEGVGASTSEVNGAVTRSRGVYVETMENGDKAHYRYELTATTKDGQVQITGHKWQLVGGTGKLKGAKGQGTCTGSGTAEAGVTYECEGEYTSPK
jgi:hypothetical protein